VDHRRRRRNQDAVFHIEAGRFIESDATIFTLLGGALTEERTPIFDLQMWWLRSIHFFISVAGGDSPAPIKL
jgi:hypothetical protein